MDADGLIDQLAAQGPLFADAAQRAGWNAAVPRTDWTVRDLTGHIGGVHRWAAEIVRTGSPDGKVATASDVGAGPPDDELLDWYLAAHADVVAALRAAPADLQAMTFLPAQSPRHFWARRQAHEAGVHRADAQRAAGDPHDVVTFAANFAQDGIEELLGGFGRGRKNAVAQPGRVGLAAADGPSWLITFGGERIESASADDLTRADATVRGLSADLYLWLWNRDSAAIVDGDADVAARWGAAVQVGWS